MNNKLFFKFSWVFTAIVTLAIWSLLIWNFYNGGIPSHHILARADLPEISNAWGAILLPLLTGLVLFRVQQRIKLADPNFTSTPKDHLAIGLGFIGALVYGVSLAVFFTLGYSDLPFILLMSILFLALFFPIYRAECLLGFVLGMTFTFGAVLPIGMGLILSILGMIIYLLVRPALLFIGSKALKKNVQNSKRK